jgi:hypothetical protein
MSDYLPNLADAGSNNDIAEFGIDASRTVVTVGTSTLVLLAANPNRKAYMIYNATGVLYIALGAVAGSITDFSIKICAGGFFAGDAYTGVITGVRATGSSDVNLTELT